MIFTAIITPFNNDKIDYKALEKLLNYQIESNVYGIVVAGSTGETLSLSEIEYLELISFVGKFIKETKKSKTKVVAGIYGSSLKDSIKKIGILNSNNNVDAFMVPTPYYTKPTQEGLYRYFMEISNSSKKDIMLYSVPSRTGCDFSLDTLYKLMHFKNIVAIKDASSNLNRASDIVSYAKSISKDFNVFAGNDAEFIQHVKLGASGIVSVLSNIKAKELVTIGNYLINKEYDVAVKLFNPLCDIIDKLFIETNPIVIKFLISRTFDINNELRLPLTKLSKEHESIFTNFAHSIN
jgi:4-hydroxy-tetrahydrodipicolinate synthase